MQLAPSPATVWNPNDSLASTWEPGEGYLRAPNPPDSEMNQNPPIDEVPDVDE